MMSKGIQWAVSLPITLNDFDVLVTDPEDAELKFENGY